MDTSLYKIENNIIRTYPVQGLWNKEKVSLEKKLGGSVNVIFLVQISFKLILNSRLVRL